MEAPDRTFVALEAPLLESPFGRTRAFNRYLPEGNRSVVIVALASGLNA